MATKAPARAKKKTAARKAVAKPRKRVATARAAASAPIVVEVTPRRAVFIDVENTSSESELARVLDELQIDLKSGHTDVTAIGNWRVVGQHLGRALAQRGAQLVHSAPATRVPDWSDLWIAVQAGIWLGRSRPGDRVEIVSHDRAFDAVGDAAARLGVAFQRITYRSAAPSAHAAERAAEPTGERRRRRRRRGGSGRGATSASTAPAAPHAPRVDVADAHDEPHAASQEQLQHVIARLAGADPARTVTLDALTVALKAAGFQRPPGSPRLVTRLRRMKNVEVLANGKVRLHEDVELAEPAAESLAEAAVQNGTEPSGESEAEAAPEAPAKRRSRRRGGRRRGGRGRKKDATTEAAPTE